MINVDIENNGQVVVYGTTITDSARSEKIHFNFPESWNGYVKKALFKNGEKTVGVFLNADKTICTGEDECFIPHEVIKAPQFTASVFGVSGDSRVTSAEATIKVTESGYTKGDFPTNPSPTEYEQLLNIAAETKKIAQSVRTDADNGNFKGEKGDIGPQGDKGEKGDTGEQGVQGIQGEKGDKGDKGDKGNPFIYSDFTPEQLAELKGDKGDKGEKGDKGDKGNAFTYEDFTTEQLEALKGEKGDAGIIENIDQIFNPISENAQSGKALSETFAASIKKYVSGNSIIINDISSVPHSIKISLQNKNLFNLNAMMIASNWKTDGSLSVNGYWNFPILGLKKYTSYTLSMTKNAWSGVENNGFYVSLRNDIGRFNEETSICHGSGTDGYCKSQVTIKSNEDGLLYLSFYNPTDERLSSFFEKCSDIILAEGETPAEFTPFINDFSEINLTVISDLKSETIKASSNGIVENLISIYPNMTIITDSNAVVINCEYNVDTKKYIDNKIAELMQ